jgi:ribosomal protein L39E
MSTRAKKTRLSISVDPDLVEKLAEAAEEGYGGNVSRLITAVLWREFSGEGRSGEKTAGGGKGAAGPAPDEEVERCHRLLLRLRKERRLPPWVTLATGEIVVDGQAFPYVKKWRLDTATASAPAREIVRALTRLAGGKKA